MPKKYDRLSDRYYRAYFINSRIEAQPDGTYQLLSGLAYLETDLPLELELYDTKGKAVGLICFTETLVKQIRVAFSQANTVFIFKPYDTAAAQPIQAQEGLKYRRF